jgi:hypothetical protein
MRRYASVLVAKVVATGMDFGGNCGPCPAKLLRCGRKRIQRTAEIPIRDQEVGGSNPL